MTERTWHRRPKTHVKAFTLVEALMAVLVLGIMITGVVGGFVQSHRTAEWSAYSLAAQSLAVQSMEQARAAKWDIYKAIPVDQLVSSNFPNTINVLDIPISGTNIVYARNQVRIRNVSTVPPLKEIYVECIWDFPNRGTFTNSILTYRAPDQ